MNSWNCRRATLLLALAGCANSSQPEPIVDNNAPQDGPYFAAVSPPLPVPAPNLFDVWGDETGRLWIVGEKGFVLHFDGSYWSETASGVTTDLRSVFGRRMRQPPEGATDPYEVFIVGTDGTILRYALGAITTEQSPTALDLTGVSAGSDTVLAVGVSGTIISRGVDGVWTITASQTVENLNSIWVQEDGQAAVAVGNLGMILAWDSQNWSRIRVAGVTTPLQAAWGRNIGNMYVVGLDGTVLVRRDGGDFQSIDGGPKIYLRDIWGLSMGDAYIVGWGGIVAHTDGATITTYDGFTNNRLEAVWGFNEPLPEPGPNGEKLYTPRFYAIGVSGSVLSGP